MIAQKAGSLQCTENGTGTNNNTPAPATGREEGGKMRTRKQLFAEAMRIVRETKANPAKNHIQVEQAKDNARYFATAGEVKRFRL